ncbi:MAG TPA: hypothetical protein VFZ25_13250 [Chloroflexota bacterium]|nr:hypothetical protein [Chloroflexota bacterium]
MSSWNDVVAAEPEFAERVRRLALHSPTDHLVIESWHPDRGLQRRRRR